ncbi:MAG: hypothetical protein ACK4ND_01465 [Cytophagaceae bacterium]
MKKYCLLFVGIIFSGIVSYAQTASTEDASELTPPKDTLSKVGIAKLKYIKQPGLANAASKIFSADQRYAISGFGEINYVNYLGPKSRDGGDVELYYTNLYRSGTYFGYKLTDKLIFMSELQMELLHDGTDEVHFEYNLEAILDLLLHNRFNIRIGNYPVPMGYVNINEEPIAFYTVNRPEVERVIIPTQWLETGLLFYGNLGKGLEYNAGVTKGLDASDFTEGSWIRQGRYHWYKPSPGHAFNGKLLFTGIKNFETAISGYSGETRRLPMGEQGQQLQSRVSLLSAYLTYDYKNFSFFGLGARGWLTGTDQIYNFNENVLGAETFGYYAELRCDVLPYFAKTDWKLPLFVRYERLNTHHSISPELADIARAQQDLEIITVGGNLRPKKNITLKANYQFRNNRYTDSFLPESNRFEMGLGFIF